MKLSSFSLRHSALVLAAALACSSTVAFAVEAEKGERTRKRGGARALARFDRNSDGALDATEGERVRRLYLATRALDTDKDGSLSDSEIAAARIPAGGKGKGARKKKTEGQ